jgi:hypothetical protein
MALLFVTHAHDLPEKTGFSTIRSLTVASKRPSSELWQSLARVHCKGDADRLSTR